MALVPRNPVLALTSTAAPVGVPVAISLLFMMIVNSQLAAQDEMLNSADMYRRGGDRYHALTAFKRRSRKRGAVAQ